MIACGAALGIFLALLLVSTLFFVVFLLWLISRWILIRPPFKKSTEYTQRTQLMRPEEYRR